MADDVLKFDLVVIGGGPGGYVAAIRAAQLGMKVACVEARPKLGGTCLNVGCIPSKALLQSSEKFEDAQNHFKEHGIDVGKLSLNLKAMMKRKSDVVSNLQNGIDFLFKKNKIARFEGVGTIKAQHEVSVTGKDKGTLYTKNILIATGSEVMPLPGVEIDEKKIVSSTGALELTSVPKRLVVIGGGYIGLELGSVWRRLGSKVTVVEYLDRIVPAMDKEVGTQFHKILKAQGIDFKLGMKVTAAKSTKTGVTLELESAAGGAKEKLEADVVLVSIGRRAFTQNLGLEKVNIKTDKRGLIEVNDHLQTSVSTIYAIGDVIKGPMLAHKAEEEGVAVAETLAGQAGHVNYGIIPAVVYTWPEVGTVGKTEEELKEAGIEYTVGKFPFMANSRARAMGDTDGMVKILACKKTDRVLGAHILGPDAGTLIAEIAAVMEFGGSSEDIARTCHAHPTLNEAVKEAALAVDSRAIHM